MITLIKQRNVILVNEVYPADCLIFKALVNEHQTQYRVPGHEDALIVQQPPTSEVSSETSLQLKPEKKDCRPRQQTPSEIKGSEQTSLSRVAEDADFAKGYGLERNPMNSQTGSLEQTSSDGVNDDVDPAGGSSLQRSPTHPHAYPQNDLDKAIEEAQATKDLVSMGKCLRRLCTDYLVAPRPG